MNATGAKDTSIAGGVYGVVTVPTMLNGTVIINGTPAGQDTVNFEVHALSGYVLQSETGTGAGATTKYFITVTNSARARPSRKSILW